MLLLVGVGRGTWSPRMWVGEAHINLQDDSTAIWPSPRHWLRRPQFSSYERFVACSCSRKCYPYPKGQVTKAKWCSEISAWGEPGGCDGWGHAAEELPSTRSSAPLAAHVPGQAASNQHLQQKAAWGEPKGHDLTCHVASCGQLVGFWRLVLRLWSEREAGRGGVGGVFGRGRREQPCGKEEGLLQEGKWGRRRVVRQMKFAALMWE